VPRRWWPDALSARACARCKLPPLREACPQTTLYPTTCTIDTLARTTIDNNTRKHCSYSHSMAHGVLERVRVLMGGPPWQSPRQLHEDQYAGSNPFLAKY
jgi:hypothetical protein